MIGHVIDRYRIVSRLGAGGMGVVYRAVDDTLGRDVALKFLGELEDGSDALPRFLREARAVSKLDHPNICTVYEIGKTPEGGLFIAMACYDGETLKSRLERGALALAEALEITRQITLGLRAAHAEQIIHRDIKPANIFITHEGLVKILDFGLAKVAGEPPLTRTGSSIGTPCYMAPEQILGDAEVRSDLWALGMLLYEMLAGESAFQAENDFAVIHAVLNKNVPSLKARRPDLPPSLQLLLDGLLAKNPSERFASADSVLEALPPPPSEHHPQIVSERWQSLTLSGNARRRVVSTFAGLLALAVAGVAVWLGIDKAADPNGLAGQAPAESIPAEGAPLAQRSPRSLVVLPFSYQGSPALDYLGKSMVQLLSLGLENTRGLVVHHQKASLGPLEGVIHSRAPEHTSALARALGCDLLVVGDIVEVAGRINIEARCYQTDGKELATASTEGSADRVFELARQVAEDLAEGLGKKSP